MFGSVENNRATEDWDSSVNVMLLSSLLPSFTSWCFMFREEF
jgi:hypothetical protein